MFELKVLKAWGPYKVGSTVSIAKKDVRAYVAKGLVKEPVSVVTEIGSPPKKRKRRSRNNF